MKRFLLLLLSLPLQSGFLSASDKAKQDAVALIQEAEARTDIFALPTFVMKADLRLDNQGKPIEGKYLLLWNGPDHWREEISVPGYRQIQVGGKGVVYTKRSVDFMPLAVEQIHAALGYGPSSHGPNSFFQAAPDSREVVKKIKERKINGSKADCVEIEEPENWTREVCIDQTTHLIVRNNSFHDQDFAPIGDKLFPRFLSFTDNGKSVVQVRITEFTTGGPLPETALQPFPAVVPQPGCMNPTWAHLVKRAEPRYPEEDKQAHNSGDVSIYVRIGTDGATRGLRVVAGVSPSLNQASLDAVRGWSYEPAMCSGSAVEVDSVVTVKYRLGP